VKNLPMKAAATARLTEPVQRYLDALLAGDEDAASAAVTIFAGKGASTADVYIELLTPGMVRVGDLWRKRKINVAQQKLATQITLSQMDRLRSLAVPKPRSTYRSLVCCVKGELHFTGARMVADLLRLAGWSVDFLGADVPPQDVLAMVQNRRPHLVAVSVTMQSNLAGVRDLLTGLAKLPKPPRVLAGGQASFGLTENKIGDLDLIVAPDLREGLHRVLGAFRSTPPKVELKEYLKAIGQRIRALRTQTGRTQAQLAAAAGLNRAYIVSVEHGKQNITMGVVIKIANALGVSAGELLAA
jgi:methanogenic corrinoid protein MtbC1/DNA-binding XRE family transcriptional regulator